MKVKNFVIYCFAILNYAKLSKLSIVLHNNSLILQYPNLTAGHSVNGQCTVKDDHHTITNRTFIKTAHLLLHLYQSRNYCCLHQNLKNLLQRDIFQYLPKIRTSKYRAFYSSGSHENFGKSWGTAQNTAQVAPKSKAAALMICKSQYSHWIGFLAAPSSLT